MAEDPSKCGVNAKDVWDTEIYKIANTIRKDKDKMTDSNLVTHYKNLDTYTTILNQAINRARTTIYKPEVEADEGVIERQFKLLAKAIEVHSDNDDDSKVKAAVADLNNFMTSYKDTLAKSMGIIVEVLDEAIPDLQDSEESFNTLGISKIYEKLNSTTTHLKGILEKVDGIKIATKGLVPPARADVQATIDKIFNAYAGAASLTVKEKNSAKRITQAYTEEAAKIKARKTRSAKAKAGSSDTPSDGGKTK